MADVACSVCSHVVSDLLTICPSCRGLVHRARLQSIAADADQAAANGDFAREARLWRDALPLLPLGSTQHDAVAARLDNAVAKIKQTPASGRRTGVIASAGAAIIALLSKGKLLLAGFAKLSTIISMFAFLGVYWKTWGFSFAAAIVLTIYIHEIGHVAALKSRGLAATAPMFIPGLGAFVGMKDAPSTPGEDARIGLAGPWWGLGAIVAASGVFAATHAPFWLAVAQTTAIINLFNLTPVWQLDGSRGFAALTREQRWIAVAIIGIAWAMSRQGVLILVGLVAIWRAFEKQAPPRHDWGALAQYTLLLAALSAFATLRP